MADMAFYRNRLQWLTAEDLAYVAKVKAETGWPQGELEFAIANQRRNEASAARYAKQGKA